MRHNSTSAGTKRRQVTIDNDTGLIAPSPAMAGFWDGLVSVGKDIGSTLKTTAVDTAKALAQAKVEQKKAETQIKILNAEAEAEAKRKLAEAQALKNNIPGVSYGVEWYRDPKVMLPVAIGLGALLFYMKKKGK